MLMRIDGASRYKGALQRLLIVLVGHLRHVSVKTDVSRPFIKLTSKAVINLLRWCFLPSFPSFSSFPFPLSFPRAAKWPFKPSYEIWGSAVSSANGRRTTVAATRHILWALNSPKRISGVFRAKMSSGCKCRRISVKRNLKLKQMWLPVFPNLLYVTLRSLNKFCVIFFIFYFGGEGMNVPTSKTPRWQLVTTP